MTFSKRLQSLIISKNIQQKDIARALKIHENRIGEWLSEKVKKPRAATIAKLADYFNVNPDWLATGEGPQQHEMSQVTKDARLEFLEKEWKKNRGRDLVSITYIEENYASAGKGIINYDAAKEVMQFDRNFLIGQFGPTDFENVHIIHAVGDSMTPAIVSGDMLFVNPGEKDIVTGAVYVLVVGEETMVKRVERNPLSGELTLRSDNAQYAPIEILKDDLDKVYVIGRVLGNFKKF
jgi:repressor LexA